VDDIPPAIWKVPRFIRLVEIDESHGETAPSGQHSGTTNAHTSSDWRRMLAPKQSDLFERLTTILAVCLSKRNGSFAPFSAAVVRLMPLVRSVMLMEHARNVARIVLCSNSEK
jgi:hypothetical protein